MDSLSQLEFYIYMNTPIGHIGYQTQDWITKNLFPKADKEEVRAALSKLEAMGLIESKNEKVYIKKED